MMEIKKSTHPDERKRVMTALRPFARLRQD